METAVRIENLRKADGSIVAVDDVSIEVREGEIFGYGKRLICSLRSTITQLTGGPY